MKNILITGSYGQLGTALRNIMPDIADVFFTDADTLDICNRAAILDFARAHAIHYIINCAAYTAVDKAEDDAETCNRINHLAVRNIGEVASSVGAKVIHISTDYVFDGKKDSTKAYCEDDAVSPKSVYGRTKLAGEEALTATCPASIIIRTAWLYSETGNNFVKTMLRLGASRDEIGVVADQYGTPTYAGDLAKAIIKILLSDNFVSGIYHYTDEGICTWYDFACEIMRIAGLSCRVIPLTTAEYPTRAVRPAYSVLDKTKIRETYGVVTPQWQESLAVVMRSALIQN
ncbi:MAG: dTDP-4-dehydrorhamnose reductase [Tannerella sp.]|nr:dTDP-4-dehydrorhamnose reductase [Tannerella sp.]